MLNKLVEGRYLNTPAFDNTTPAVPAVGLPPHFVLVNGRSYNIAESTGKWNPFAHTSSVVTAGAHATKTHRTFRWLPWLKGKISITPLAGSDILTGPFSGCWVPIFTLGGTQYAGHIGTFETADTPESIQAKNAWTAATALPGFTLHAAFNPARQFPIGWQAVAQRKGATMDILAAVSPAQICQLVGVSPYLQSGAGEKEILGAAVVPSIHGSMDF